MPNRGVNFDFEPNELVLCFEPDSTKAKVLYYAKILEQCVGNKDRHGRRKAEYMIHFQGWNSSWDRIVPASFVLKNDDENRALMRRLANIARQVKRNKIRRRRIDEILKKHFKRSRIHDDSDSEESSSEEDSDSDYTDIDLQDDHREEEEDERPAKKPKTDSEEDGDETDDSQATTPTGNDDQEEEEEESDEEDEEEEEPRHIDLELPENLRKKLEDDCINIKVHNKLVNLPASPNIVTLLEAYVKNFGVNVLCATGEKNRGNSYNIPPDRNIGICKELVDGLRVIFDFTLPTLLLYTAEKKQYEQLIQGPHAPIPAVQVKQEQHEEEEQHEPVSRPRRSSHRLSSPPATSSSPKLPRLFPSTSKEHEDTQDEDDEEEEAIAPRRITRHAYQEEVKRTRRDSSGGSGRATRSSVTAAAHTTATTTTTTTNNNNKTLSERVTPPPPLLIPSHISCQSVGGSQPNTPPAGQEGGAEQTKEAAVNNIFSWKMFKEDYSGENTLCMLYGPHHLLRLLVKLPDVLTEMRLPDISLKYLLRHLELFIDYLSNRSEELFPDSVYVEIGEA